jgi:hypothetical protein
MSTRRIGPRRDVHNGAFTDIKAIRTTRWRHSTGGIDVV